MSLIPSDNKREKLEVSRRAVGLGIAGLVLAVTASIAERVHDHSERVRIDGRIQQALIQKFNTPQ